jgi:hypothetical protein
VVVDGSWEFVLNDELLVFGNGMDSYGNYYIVGFGLGIWKLTEVWDF